MERYSIINFKVILLYGLQQSVPDAGKDLCRDILTGPLFFSGCLFGILWLLLVFFFRFLRVSAFFLASLLFCFFWLSDSLMLQCFFLHFFCSFCGLLFCAFAFSILHFFLHTFFLHTFFLHTFFLYFCLSIFLLHSWFHYLWNFLFFWTLIYYLITFYIFNFSLYFHSDMYIYYIYL